MNGDDTVPVEYLIPRGSIDLVLIDDGHGGLFGITFEQLRALTEASPASRETLRAKWAAEAGRTP